MEGKEVRFGVPNSATFAAATTLTSTGAVNSFHDSYTALGGMMPMVNMMLGEVAPGGVGSGLYGMLDPRRDHGVRGRADGRPHAGVPGQEDRRPGDQVRLAVLPDHPGAGADRHGGRDGRPGNGRRMLNVGPHGLSEVLYAFTSAANNNGSAFAGITVNTAWWNTALGPGHAARPVPADHLRARPGRLAGPADSRSRRRRARCPPTSRCSSAWSSASTVILVALTFLPALALGPLAEGLSLMSTPDARDAPARSHRAAPAGSRPGRRRPARPASSCGRSLPDALRKLNPAHAVAQPGHAHRRDRRGVHHRAGGRRPVACSPGRSRSGCG